MKRIFKYIMGAICCSIILALIFPSAFLEGDAKWISQSDMGRMDISFEGDIKNGKVEVKGDDIKVYEPGWFLKENYQGTLIHFPISYFKKLYQISIVPQGYKTGEDFSLIFTFRGQDLRENNQVKPAWVKFSHIKVNGKLISNEQTVWHNNPFRYSLKNLSDFNPIQIELEIQKPLVLKNNIVWKNLMAFWGLFLLLFWFPFSQKIGKIIFSKTVKIFSLIINTDIVKVVSDGYFKIDRVYRHSFWIIFGVLCVAFGFHTIHYMWGNHDWGFLVYSRPWDERMFEGRYAVNSFKILFLNGIYLPMIYDIIAFLTLALNAVLLCVYWKLKKRIIYFVLCGLILTAQPFTLGFIYYTHMLPETFIGISFALTALLLSEKIAFEKCSFIKKILISVIAIILINLSLAMYPVIISTTAVAFIGRLLIQSLDWNGSWKNFKSCFFPFFISAVNIVFGIGLYKIMTTFIFPLKSFYNTDMLPLEKLPERLWILLKRSFNQLYEYYPFSFISRPITWVFLSFTVIMVLYICFKGSIKQKIIRLLLLFGALFATQTAMIIANTYVITIRLELFGFVVFETLTAVLIFSNLRKLHNFAVIATMSVVFVSVVNDLDCLRVWKFSFDTEKMLWNRVLTRLEAQENFDINQKYRIVQIGESACCFGSNFYKNSSWLINVLLSYEAPWGLFRPHEFYYPVHFISKSYKADITNPEYKAELKRLYEAGILDKAKVWPNKNGLIVWQDIILYVTDEKVLNNYKKQLEEEYRKTKESPVEDLLETDKVLSKDNTKLF